MPLEYHFTSRHLSAAEAVSDVLHQVGSGVLLHVAILRSDVELTRTALGGALAKLVIFQPALQMKIVTEKREKGGFKKRFVAMEELNANVIVKRAADRRSWLQTAEEQLAEPFNPEKGPLWGVTYIEFGDQGDGSGTSDSFKSGSSRGEIEGALLFKIHHAIADGVSMFDLLYGQLVPLINLELGQGDGSKFATTLSMLPSPDESFLEKSKKRHSVKAPSSGLGAELGGKEGSAGVAFRPLMSSIPRNGIPTAPACARVLPFLMSPSSTKAVMDCCHQNGVTVHSCVMAACSLALGLLSSWDKLPLPPGEDLVVGYSVDLRQFRTLASPQPLGLWLGYGTAKCRRQPTHLEPARFWEEVRRVHTATHMDTKPWQHLDHCSRVLQRVVKSGQLAPLRDLYQVHLQIDNLGNCDKRAGLTKSAARIFSRSAPPTSKLSRNSSRASRPVSSIEDVSVMEDQRRSQIRSATIPSDPKMDSQHVKMQEHYFMKSMSDLSTVPLVASVATFKGKLMWTVTYNAKWLTRELATKFVDLVLRIVQDMTHPAYAKISDVSRLLPYWRAQYLRS